MQETQTIPRVSKPSDRRAHRFASTAVFTIAVVFLVGALIGGWAVRARYTPPMQGNEACKAAMVAQSKQLQSALNTQFGTPVQAGTPSLDDVKALQGKCDETFEMYTVKVEAQK